MKISQREARRLKKRVEELEAREERRRNGWVRDYPGGVFLCTAFFAKESLVPVAIQTARRLGHAVVAIEQENGNVMFFGVKP